MRKKPVALTTTSAINRNVFFPYAKLQKRVKTAQSRSKNKLLLGFKKSWEGFPPSKILPNF